MFGASMAAPLAIPPTTKPSASTTTVLILVSVVKIALAAAWRTRASAPPGHESGQGRLDPVPGREATPIVPVEQTKTCSRRDAERRADSSQVSSAAIRPSGPVAALAQPLFRTTAAVIAAALGEMGAADLHGRRSQRGWR